MRTVLMKTKGDWREVVDDCRATIGKPGLGKEPSAEFKRRILLAEHSPIRDISFKWKWPDMPHWVTVHWVRHKWECFVRTQREDRAGVPRAQLSQTEPQDFTGEANVQALIDTMRKRLCYQASRETREYAEDLKAAIHGKEPEIADVLVPNCIYRCGCPEMGSCRRFERMLERNSAIASTDIRERYNAFNTLFWEGREDV